MSATLARYSISFLTGLLLAHASSSYAKSEFPTHSVKQQLFKLDHNGSKLSKEAIKWSCVEDASTGLFWQKRDPSRALHNQASYTWYQPLSNNAGSELAYPTSSQLNVTCADYHHDDPASYCNTDAYTKRVNQTNYCGYSDWRLPTTIELITLALKNRSTQTDLAAINLNYFPFYDRFVYWTRSINSAGQVLTIAQETQILANAEPSDQLSVRLVRGTQY